MAQGKVRDLHGRHATLAHSRWAHIVDPDYGHPEMAGLWAEVLKAVVAPDRWHRGRESNEAWFYRRNVGPSRWIKVVVIYEGDCSSIITAFPRRSFP